MHISILTKMEIEHYKTHCATCIIFHNAWYLANEIIMWWTVRVHNEAWSDLKIYLKCDEKRLYFKTLKSKMVYLSISMCFIYFRRTILGAKVTLTYWRQNLTSSKSIVSFEWLPLVNHSTYNEKHTTYLYTKLNTTTQYAYTLNMLQGKQYVSVVKWDYV